MSSLSIRNMKWTMEELRQIDEARVEKERKERKCRIYWQQRMDLAMGTLGALDPAWEKWYDDDNNIPYLSSHKQICLLLEKRIKELNPAWKAPRGRFEEFSYNLVWKEGEK